MKRSILQTLSETLEKLIKERSMSLKELAQKSNISYSSLVPILNGSRDFGITKLIDIANALECNADTLLDGLLLCKDKTTSPPNKKITPRYLAVFISMISVTHCLLYDTETKKSLTSVFPFNLGCLQDQNDFLDSIISSLKKMIPQKKEKNIDLKEIAVFASAQQENSSHTEKIQKSGDNMFLYFVIEADAITSYRALFNKKNGICITINDGSIIVYSLDNGKTFTKLQGYGFPIADTAGNHWIGCEAIKYVINVKENLEPSSILSDRILSQFNDSVNSLAESVMLKPAITYTQASKIVKELIFVEPRAHAIIQKSAKLLLDRIKLIDNSTKIKLPITLVGELGSMYKEFFPRERVLNIREKLSLLLLDSGIASLKEVIKISNQ
jgi:N-acetylglucosamine kinase-like BadF-type ATPase